MLQRRRAARRQRCHATPVALFLFERRRYARARLHAARHSYDFPSDYAMILFALICLIFAFVADDACAPRQIIYCRRCFSAMQICAPFSPPCFCARARRYCLYRAAFSYPRAERQRWLPGLFCRHAAMPRRCHLLPLFSFLLRRAAMAAR